MVDAGICTPGPTIPFFISGSPIASEIIQENLSINIMTGSQPFGRFSDPPVLGPCLPAGTRGLSYLSTGGKKANSIPTGERFKFLAIRRQTISPIGAK